MSAQEPGSPPPPRPGQVSGPLLVPAGGSGRPGRILVIPGYELAWRFSRSSGPGGQSVNTMDSRVELSWDLAGSSALTDEQRERMTARLAGRFTGGPDGQVVTVAASEYRSQLRNREAARERLTAILAAALAAPPRTRRPTRPSRGAVAHRIEDKVRRSGIKQLRRPPGEHD
ncbi:MAG TPA: alternative ribosome rescue aminoacyl-tRNA hydrolase ArfB [Actinocrinis sp.]|nr:alternative ribosome rescue aminoacyl-tRNA hydrolase ArfB [Actinocrinis sp.]